MFLSSARLSSVEPKDLSFCRPQSLDSVPQFPRELCTPELRQLLSPIFDGTGTPSPTSSTVRLRHRYVHPPPITSCIPAFTSCEWLLCYLSYRVISLITSCIPAFTSCERLLSYLSYRVISLITSCIPAFTSCERLPSYLSYRVISLITSCIPAFTSCERLLCYLSTLSQQ